MAGYATLLMGQGVPFQKTYEPTANEMRVFEAHREKHLRFAQFALGVRESLQAVRSPKWIWDTP